jgi:hypothetical protein
MTFSDDLGRFNEKADANLRAVFLGSVAEVHRSVSVGSEITGAPGQPVDTGNLRGSWQAIFAEPASTVSTNVEYAPSIEDGISHRWGTALTLRSAVGGFHSVEHTVNGYDKIVEHVLKAVAPEG